MKTKLLMAFLSTIIFVSPTFAKDVIEFKPTFQKSSSLLVLNKTEPELFKPTGFIIGQANIIKVKAKPNSTVEVMLSLQKEGSSLFHGKYLRLGEDKQVFKATTSENGILEIPVRMNGVEKLAGEDIFIEAVSWTNNDFSDVKIAKIINADGIAVDDNSIVLKDPPTTNFLPGFGSIVPGVSDKFVNSIESIKKETVDGTTNDYNYDPSAPVYLQNMNAPELRK